MLIVKRGVRSLRTWAATGAGRKAVRYLAVSVLNVVLGEAVLGLCILVLGWSVLTAAVVAGVVATIPAYYLNRTWVWGRTGRSHLVKEVIPFWVLALVYLVLLVGAAQAASAAATRLTGSRPVQTVIIMSAILVASAVLWLLRFFVLDAIIFPGRSRRDRLVGAAADVRG
jgi:putative flippase GtrA